MWDGYPLMEGLSWVALALTYLGAAVLGGAIAYGIIQWRAARKEETPAEKERREEATRQAFHD